MKHFPQLQRAAAVKINGSSGGSSGNFSAYAAADELRSTVTDTRQNQPLQIEIDDRECWLCAFCLIQQEGELRAKKTNSTNDLFCRKFRNQLILRLRSLVCWVDFLLKCDEGERWVTLARHRRVIKDFLFLSKHFPCRRDFYINFATSSRLVLHFVALQKKFYAPKMGLECCSSAYNICREKTELSIMFYHLMPIEWKKFLKLRRVYNYFNFILLQRVEQ